MIGPESLPTEISTKKKQNRQLDNDVVLAIKRMLKDGVRTSDIAERYGITQSTVSKIKKQGY